ncbi:tyrosinase family oxidase copper chaperone [Streptomyces sp. P9(2023)]|uniref:tyrosinase family oxidase copper chaperone n=1 Tax=Streptomyces sp. P9(2023) TaxID=3064394 RepID=UPI0028F3EF06|nr:tyrosinase family oxidase copper chaperone [Streptomyces sp. P9(2023)]MDT9688509.1 tyrosinase family oxidase copper chaperone [Streptomyces sp. P9(2023)]
MIVPRRVALRSLFTLAVAAFTGGTLARIAATPDERNARAASGPSADESFDEMYGGRRIRGLTGPSGDLLVLVDGRPLHVMRRADGGYLTPIDHYESHATPLAATRAAVDELGPAPLTRYAAAHGVHPGGSPRGLHT